MFGKSKGKIKKISTMRGSTLNAKPTLFCSAHKAWWCPLYIGWKGACEVILLNVDLKYFS